MAGSFDNGFYGPDQNSFYGVTEVTPVREAGTISQYGAPAYGTQEYGGEYPFEIGTGVAAGVSTTTGALRLVHRLAGDSNGDSTVVGATVVAHPMAGASTGVSTATVAAIVGHPLAGAAIGISTLTGASRISISLSGSIISYRLFPDALLEQTQFTGVLADIQEPAAVGDSTWMTPTGDGVLRFSFPTPQRVPGDEQEFRILVKPG